MHANKQQRKWKYRVITDVLITTFILIALGILFIGRNLGYIDSYISRIFISWQMLLIVLGIWSILHRGYKWGITIIGIGTFFLIPNILNLGSEWISTYWPLILIFFGIMILIYLLLPKRWTHHAAGYEVTTDYSSEDGFVKSDNNFGNLRQVVLDEMFMGAEIKNRFGATEIDLRRSTLEAGNTYIDLESSFGGVVILVPEHWIVQIELQPFLSGVEDKRFRTTMESEGRLIIRGKISFSGIEIKS